MQAATKILGVPGLFLKAPFLLARVHMVIEYISSLQAVFMKSNPYDRLRSSMFLATSCKWRWSSSVPRGESRLPRWQIIIADLKIFFHFWGTLPAARFYFSHSFLDPSTVKLLYDTNIHSCVAFIFLESIHPTNDRSAVNILFAYANARNTVFRLSFVYISST